MIRNFIVYTTDGATYDNSGIEVENCQILDFIKAKDIKEASQIANKNKYGDFSDIKIVEYIEWYSNI